MNSPTVSVIMTAHNREAYITDAINSILNQSLQDLELIIVNDASTDNTINVVQKIKDPRIRIHNNPKNLGLAGSINVGVELCKGKYITRMDDDDISLPKRLELQVKFLERNPHIDVVGVNSKRFGKRSRRRFIASADEKIKTKMFFGSDLVGASAMFRRKRIQGKLKFDEKLRQAEDYEFFSRYANELTYANINKILYLQRVHGSQIMTSKEFIKQDSILSQQWVNKFLEQPHPMPSFHYKFTKLKPLPPEEIKELPNWISKLISQNKKNHFFHHPTFRNQLIIRGLYYAITTKEISPMNRIELIFSGINK